MSATMFLNRADATVGSLMVGEIQPIPSTQATFATTPAVSPGIDWAVLSSGGPANSGYVLTVQADGSLAWDASSRGGGGTPGGTTGQIQYDNGGSFGGFTMSGDATLVTSTGVITIASTAVTYAKMQHASAGSVLLGNPTGSAAALSEITLAGGLGFSSSTITINASNIATGQLPVAYGGTNAATAAAARTNLGIEQGNHTFGASGTPTLNATTPPIYLPTALTCIQAVAACGTAPGTGGATLTIQTSATGASGSWGTLVAVTIASGAYYGTAAVTSSIAAGTWIQGEFTAVNAVQNMTATLYVEG
jgi:Repeat of unknown function (DUF5907)